MADQPNLGPDPTTYRAAGAGGPKLPKLPPVIEDTGKLIDHFTEFMGGKVRAGKVLPGFNRLIITYLAPQPFGVTKPQIFGLPEDYLPFGLTPKQVVEALEQTGPQDLYNKLQFEQRRDLLLSELDKIDGELNLRQRTDTELETLLKVLPPSLDPFDAGSLGAMAIKREQGRRIAEQNRRDRLQLPPLPQPGIETRGDVVTDPAHVDWPTPRGITDALSVFGFIDDLVAALPPDP